MVDDDHFLSIAEYVAPQALMLLVGAVQVDPRLTPI